VTKLVRYLRSDRTSNGVMNEGDVAGVPDHVAGKLVTQGFAELFDAGKGPGVPILGTPHVREAWEGEDDATWQRRKAEVEAASTKEASTQRDKVARFLVDSERERRAARAA